MRHASNVTSSAGQAIAATPPSAAGTHAALAKLPDGYHPFVHVWPPSKTQRGAWRKLRAAVDEAQVTATVNAAGYEVPALDPQLTPASSPAEVSL